MGTTDSGNSYIHSLGKWRVGSSALSIVNRGLRRANVRLRLRRGIDHRHDMTTIEHRINLHHLVEQVCAYDVPGAIVEFGSFVGETSVVLGKVAKEFGRVADLRLFDHFEKSFGSTDDVRTQLEQSLQSVGCGDATVIKGDFFETVPSQLTERLALCHVDCGSGGDPNTHAEVIEHLLKHAYPRLSPSGILVFMDYYDGRHPMARNANPGVKLACDRFFADKHESVASLYAGDGCQGYLRKADA